MASTLLRCRPCDLLCWCLLLSLAGCSRGPQRVGLNGTIAYKGEPIKTGSIVFEPIGEAQAYSAGAIVVDGRYSIPANKGVLPGKYSIKISSTAPIDRNSPDAVPGSALVARQLLPDKYNRQTQLTQEVTSANPNVIDFKLD